MSGDNDSRIWPVELRKRTREVLTDLPMESFIMNSECYLKNVDGRYGAIQLADLLRNDYRVCVKKKRNRSMARFKSIDDLIDGGWVID
jgi:hypothetical protein